MAFLCGFANVHADTEKIDNLLVKLKSIRHDDTTKVNLLNIIADNLSKSDSSKAKQYASDALKMASTIGYPLGIADYNWVMGNIVSYHKSYEKAMNHYSDALKIAVEVKCETCELKYLTSIVITEKAMGNKDLALEHNKRATAIAIKLNDKKRLAHCMLIQASIYENMGKFDLALEGFEDVVKLCDETGNLRHKASALNNIGNIFYEKGFYNKAQEYYFQSLKTKEQQNDDRGASSTMLNIGTTFYHLKNYQRAGEFTRQSLAIAEKLGDKRQIGRCLMGLGDIALMTNQPQATEYYEKARQISEELSYIPLLINTLEGLGSVATTNKDYEKAKYYYNIALNTAIKIKQTKVESKLNYLLGKTYLSLGRYNEAQSHIYKSLKFADENNINDIKRTCHNLLAEMFTLKGDYKMALKHKDLFQIYNDSLVNDQNKREAEEMLFTYRLESEKKSMEMEQRQRDMVSEAQSKAQKNVILVLIIGLVLMAILAAIIYRSYIAKQRMNSLLTRQKQIIEDQNIKLQEFNDGKDKFFGIMAHDLKGSFNSIIGFSKLMKEEMPHYTAQELTEMADAIYLSANNTFKLLENLIEWSKTKIGVASFEPILINFTDFAAKNRHQWESNTEAKDITLNIAIDHKSTSIYADKDMLGSILRNLVSNAVKFSPRGGVVTISASKTDNGNEIMVADTGIGMTQESIDDLFNIGKVKSLPGTEREMGTGLGLLLSFEFVKRHNGRIKIESQIGKGSTFKIYLPSRNSEQQAMQTT